MTPVNRYVEYFNKSNVEAKELGERVGKHDISTITLSKLKKIVTPNMDDELLYDEYDLNERQLITINNLLDEPINYYLDNFDYCLTASAK